MWKRWPVVAVCGTLLLSTGAPAQQRPISAGPVVLAAHRAIYDLTLDVNRASNSIAGLSGRMVYELTGSVCEGYTQTMRFVTRTVNQEGETSVSDQRTSTWEDGDAKQFRFSSTSYRDQEQGDQTAGTASRVEGEPDVAVSITHPDKKETSIGGQALFPAQHSIALISAARKGQNLFTADFYDGSEGGEKSYLTTALIGRPLSPGYNKSLPKVANGEKLDGIAGWPVALSYFEQGPDNKDATPTYEMAFVFFDNGVSRRLVIDNGEYSMKGELAELTWLPTEPCKRP